MKHLRNTAARERRAPILWWFLMAVTMGAILCILMWPHSRDGAVFLAVLLGAAWLAPLVAFLSLSAPRRARRPAPAEGEGSYKDWIKQARLLGRLLLYYSDNRELPDEVHQSIKAAREDLRDTLKAHPLADDLQRVCARIRAGALKEVKAGFWKANRRRIRDLTYEVEESIASRADEDEQLLMQQMVVEDAAALMVRHCMPRMLERERLACAIDCAWLAAQAAAAHKDHVSPTELAARLVIEWSDFSEPWLPARMLRRVLEPIGVEPAIPVMVISSSTALAEETPADRSVPEAAFEQSLSPGPDESASPNPPKCRRVRVRVRRDHRLHRQKKRGPSSLDILLSFGQWIRYSIRSWMLYR